VKFKNIIKAVGNLTACLNKKYKLKMKKSIKRSGLIF